MVKQLITNGSDMIITCARSDCYFEMTWPKGTAKQYVLDYFNDYNRRNGDDMECVHEYVIRENDSS